MIGEIFHGLFVAFIPCFLVSYGLFFEAFRTGALSPEGDMRGLKKRVKALSKESKINKKSASQNPLQRKWMQFGGGFYGTTSLLTFIIIEIADIINFIERFESIAHFIEQISVRMMLDLLINGLMNLLYSMAWPWYWMNEIDGSFWVYLVLAYLGYSAGVHLAQKVSISRQPQQG